MLERLTGRRPYASAGEHGLYARFAFALRYDASRVEGADVLAGRPVPAPDAAFARDYLRGPAETVWAVGSGGEHPEFPLLGEPPARLRKLGRLAVLCGACVLMGKGLFRSFRGADVLPQLREQAPRSSPFLDDTARCYARITADAPAYEAYLAALVAFAEWSRGELSRT